MIALFVEVGVENITELTVLCEVGTDSTRLDVLYNETETVRASFSCELDAMLNSVWELVSGSVQENLMHIDPSSYTAPAGSACKDCEASVIETAIGDPSWCDGM